MKEALPMATIQRAGSFDIVPINDSVQSTTDSAIFCDQDDLKDDKRNHSEFSRRFFDYIHDSSSHNSAQPSPITVRVQLHTFNAVDL
jgi:hypothetical protein